MNIIIVSKNGQNAKSISLSSLFVYMLSSISFVSLIACLFYIYISNINNLPEQSANSLAVIKTVQEQQIKISDLQNSIDKFKANADNKQENFILKLAQMQSKLINLDNLGKKIVKLNKLNPEEFNFDKSYAIGGPTTSVQDVTNSDMEQRFSEISKELLTKSEQLYAIEALFNEKLYTNNVTPAGRPAEKSWISSYLGKRKDPFTGKQSRHKGIDVAAKANSNVIATAAGIVSWANKRSGYGNLVEINHGNGIVTRYGHCKSILVSVGQKVNQGEAIAILGSTGRSTGPHVHYEVLNKGVKINPIRYVRKKRVPSSSAIL